MRRIYRNTILLSIGLISLLMHFSHFSKDLMGIHVWRQTQTQSTIINFYEEDMNILNPRRNDRGNGDGIFRMEFPLMQWMVAGIYKVFGNHLIISRFFMFIIGLFSVLGIYKLLLAIFQKETIALLGAWAFNFSPSFYYYTVNPLPDNLALCCSVWGIAMFFSWYRNNRMKLLLLSGFLMSIGALCKLPFILYFTVPFTFFAIFLFKNGVSKRLVLNILGVFSFVVFPFAWYGFLFPQWHGKGIVNGLFGNDLPISTLLDYLRHNLISTLPELLLNYGSLVFFLSGFYFLFKKKLFRRSVFILFFVWSMIILAYFIFELNMIAKIHDYYLFPFYPLLFILVGYGAYNLINLKNTFVRYFSFFLLLLLPFTAYMRMQGRWNPEAPGLNKDLLVYKSELRDAIPKNALCIVGNDKSHFISFYYIDKKGWGFHNNSLNASQLESMIEQGAQFLYSDTRKIDEDEAIKPHLKKLILKSGSIRVYALE